MKRLVVIGAGLCGSSLSALLRDHFDVTVIEQGQHAKPLFTEIECRAGAVNTTINRAEGLGGTSAYWHNALIELSADDLRKAGIRSGSLEPYYARAWSFFLSAAELRDSLHIREVNRAIVEGKRCDVAHLVRPSARTNMWERVHTQPGAPVTLVYGKAQRIDPRTQDATGHVVVATSSGIVQVEADAFLVCAGGLATPAILAVSRREEAALCAGYHDHPMAYVAKVRLRETSRLKSMWRKTTETLDVRSGLVYESEGLKTVVYLRPAANLSLHSLRGPARFILADRQNAPSFIRRAFHLCGNPAAVWEAVRMKTRFTLSGDDFAVLLLGEQAPNTTRGVALAPGQKPCLNWHVTPAERRAYQSGFRQFVEDFADEILEVRAVPSDRWAFRTAAHHSGMARQFVGDPGELSLDFFSAQGLHDTFVCDGSLLRASGIANTGLTLVALSYRLAELLSMEH